MLVLGFVVTGAFVTVGGVVPAGAAVTVGGVVLAGGAVPAVPLGTEIAGGGVAVGPAGGSGGTGIVCGATVVTVVAGRVGSRRGGVPSLRAVGRLGSAGGEGRGAGEDERADCGGDERESS